MVTQSVYGIDFKVVSGFTGEGYPSGLVYYPILPNNDLVMGFSAEVPARKYDTVNGERVGTQLSADLLLGVTNTFPLIGKTTLAAVWDDHNGMYRTDDYNKSDFYLKYVILKKHWFYSLNEHIDLGISANLVKLFTDGSKYVRILPQIKPVMRMTISF